MLLSIDRVLQFITEEKDIAKIAEMASVEKEDVIEIINKARRLLNKYEKDNIRKKIIIKKKFTEKIVDNEKDINTLNIFRGAELTVVPVNDTLIMYVAVQAQKNRSAVGIIIHDREDRQVGKIFYELDNRKDKHEALYSGIIRSIEVANYFNTNNLKIRIDDKIIKNQLDNNNEVRDDKIIKFISEINKLKKKIKTCKVELISKNLNDKAHFLAQKR